ncbi:MAG: hypothetical protein AAF702_49020 [Chloroflexota bacterium]
MSRTPAQRHHDGCVHIRLQEQKRKEQELRKQNDLRRNAYYQGQPHVPPSPTLVERIWKLVTSI